MTKEIVQSDIELATRLRDERRSDAEIIQSLVQRGVESGKATQLLDDLRHGREVTSASSLPQEFSLRRRFRSRHGAPQTGESAPAPSPAAEAHRRPSSHSEGRGRRRSKLFNQMFAALVGLAVVVVGIVLLIRYHPSSLQTEPGPAAGMSKPAASATNASAKTP